MVVLLVFTVRTNLINTPSTRNLTRALVSAVDMIIRSITGFLTKLSVRKCSTSTQFSQLVQDQKNFFLSGATKDIQFRKDQLNVLKTALEENRTAFVEAAYEDMHHPPEMTNRYEIDPSLREIDVALQNIDEWTKNEMKPADPAGQPFIVKDPRGQVLLIAPRNYPLKLILVPLASLIAAGNVAVIKPSEGPLKIGELFEQVIEEYFDKTFLSVVRGHSEELKALLRERFDFIFFTGSPEVGKIVMKAAAEHLTPVALELGGKCPCYVDADVDLSVVAERLVPVKWTNSGQTCLDPDYILTTEEVRPQLVACLTRALRKHYGDDARKNPLYGRIVGKKQFEHLTSIMRSTKAKVVYQGGEPDASDLYMPPYLLEAQADDITMREEIFGPVLPILTLPGLDDAIRFINAGEKPLAAYIFTKDNAKVEKFLRDTTSGGVTINDVNKHNTIASLPFGGVGNSGIGRCHGKYGFDTFTHEKAVLKRPI